MLKNNYYIRDLGYLKLIGILQPKTYLSNSQIGILLI